MSPTAPTPKTTTRRPRKSRDRYSDATVVLSVSMHGATKDATHKIAEGEHLGVSELIRRALGEYAVKHGYAGEIKHFEAAE